MDNDENSFGIRIFNPMLNPIFDDDIEEQILSPLSCLQEFESKWVLEFDLPLVNKKDITVSLDAGNIVSVEAKLKETFSDLQLGFKNEFRYFKKSISIPGKIDGKNITSTFSDGRLTITIPKAFKGTKIKIE